MGETATEANIVRPCQQRVDVDVIIDVDIASVESLASLISSLWSRSWGRATPALARDLPSTT
jgi:hypothetical protein